MEPDNWFDRIRAVDVRVFAAVAATLLLIIGVMWIVPTTPNSTNFAFENTRRAISDARPLEMDKTVNGSIVDGSDADFYRIGPVSSAVRFDLHLTNPSMKMLPVLRVFDTTKSLVAERTVERVRPPSATVDSSFLAQSNMIYYVQVFSQRNTTGPYTLTVSVRRP